MPVFFKSAMRTERAIDVALRAQGDAALPATVEDLRKNPALQKQRVLASIAWRTILDKLAVSRNPGGAAAVKAALPIVHAIVHELAAILQRPEWPGAELLLHVLLLQLLQADTALARRRGGSVGAFAKEDRETVVEQLGLVTHAVRCDKYLQMRMRLVSVFVTMRLAPMIQCSSLGHGL